MNPSDLNTVAPSPAVGGSKSVSTLGWDTVYMAPYTIVNEAILKQKSYPATFDFTDPTEVRIQGVWKSWQLSVGAAGKNVQMICEVESGTAGGGGLANQSLAKTQVVIQVDLKQVAATDPINDKTSQPGSGQSHALMVNQTGKGLDPAVAIIEVVVPKGFLPLLKGLLLSIFKHYFNQHIGEFNHVFAVMDLNAIADKDGFQWLKPTAFQYAVGSPENPTLENSAFGLLANVQNRPISNDQSQALDIEAMTGLKEPGANAAFVISEHMVAKNMLLNGAIATIQGSSADDFELSEDGIAIRNKREITWGHFENAHGATIAPKIAKHGFYLKADDDHVILEINNAKYENTPGVTVHMNLSQSFNFKTKRRTDGNYVFVPDMDGFGKADMSSNVSLSEDLKITEVITGAISLTIGLIFGYAAFFKGMVNAVTVEQNLAENTANFSIDAEATQTIVEENPAAVGESNQESLESADEGAQQPENPNQPQRGGIANSAKFRLLKSISASVGIGSGLIAGGIGLTKSGTELAYDTIPPFNHFARNCLGVSVWPGVKNYALKGASFRTSLVLEIAMDSAD